MKRKYKFIILIFILMLTILISGCNVLDDFTHSKLIVTDAVLKTSTAYEVNLKYIEVTIKNVGIRKAEYIRIYYKGILPNGDKTKESFFDFSELPEFNDKKVIIYPGESKTERIFNFNNANVDEIKSIEFYLTGVMNENLTQIIDIRVEK